MPWCSLACLLNFLIILGAAILPLYIAWTSNSACGCQDHLERLLRYIKSRDHLERLLRHI